MVSECTCALLLFLFSFRYFFFFYILISFVCVPFASLGSWWALFYLVDFLLFGDKVIFVESFFLSPSFFFFFLIFPKIISTKSRQWNRRKTGSIFFRLYLFKESSRRSYVLSKAHVNILFKEIKCKECVFFLCYIVIVDWIPHFIYRLNKRWM